MEESSGRPRAVDMALDEVIRENKSRNNLQRNSSRYHGSRRSRGHREYSPGRRSPPPQRHSRHSNVTVTLINDRFERNDHQATIVVSNLFHEVTRDDLYELFSQVGPLRNVRMEYDRAGRSNGVATVTFVEKKDAMQAAARFHHVPLDGYPMQIDFRTDNNNHRSNYHRSIHSRERRDQWSTRTYHSDKQDHRHRRRNKPLPETNATRLDADLDSYMMRDQ